MERNTRLIARLKRLKVHADKKTSRLYEEIIKKLEEKSGQDNYREGIEENIILRCLNDDPVLVCDKTKTILNGDTDNFLIEGDNYHSLYCLNAIMPESVDIIYIDPPYNTSSKDFIYNDTFYENRDPFIRHHTWLGFMKKRLKLAYQLLKKDGVIFISIDDNELGNLKLLCDEIFNEENFLVNMVVNTTPAGLQSSADFARKHAYCLAYRKSRSFKIENIRLSDKELQEKYDHEDDNGRYYLDRIWKRGIGGKKEDVPSLHFSIWFNQKSGEILIDEQINQKNRNDYLEILPYLSKDVPGRWTWSKEKMMAEKDRLVVKNARGRWRLYKKVYAKDDPGKKPSSLIDSKLGRTELGSIELRKIMNKKSFEYPKYSLFIRYLISLHRNKNAVVLDFFAGSATTGQAVLDLNHEDGGKRRFILCTSNENKICETIAFERLKTIITGKRTDGSIFSEGRKGNLYYFKTAFKDEMLKDDTEFVEIWKKGRKKRS